MLVEGAERLRVDEFDIAAAVQAFDARGTGRLLRLLLELPLTLSLLLNRLRLRVLRRSSLLVHRPAAVRLDLLDGRALHGRRHAGLRATARLDDRVRRRAREGGAVRLKLVQTDRRLLGDRIVPLALLVSHQLLRRDHQLLPVSYTHLTLPTNREV